MKNPHGSVEKICEECGATFYVYPYRANVARFCSRKCGAIGQKRFSGDEAPNWRGGLRNIMKNGYARIRVNGKYVYEHRHLMEEILGRKLKRTEQVHHRNGDRLDNRPENLELISIGKHSSMHLKESWGREMRFKTAICGEPRISRHGRGKICQRRGRCPHHQ